MTSIDLKNIRRHTDSELLLVEAAADELPEDLRRDYIRARKATIREKHEMIKELETVLP